VSEPTGGWTDAWPRWGLYVLLWALPVTGAMICIAGLVLGVGWVAAGGSFLIPTGILSLVFSCDIHSKRLGYVALQTVSHRDTRRKERRAKRLCKERGLAKVWKPQHAGGHWGSWTETLVRYGVKGPDATPQELFVQGEIDMAEFELQLAMESILECKKAAAQPER